MEQVSFDSSDHDELSPEYELDYSQAKPNRFANRGNVMDITATLEGITALSVEERIRIVQAILDSITAEQVYPELTPELKQELDRRAREHDANPDDVMTREEVRASIRRRK